MSKPSTVYVVVAYRWDNTNEHQYMVYAGLDKTRALEAAKGESIDRGGKYGAAVYEFHPNGTNHKRIAWFPGFAKNDAPIHNHKLDMYRSLGIAFEQAVLQGTRERVSKESWPNGQRVSLVHWVPAVVPRWMRLVYARTVRRTQWMAGKFD